MVTNCHIPHSCTEIKQDDVPTFELLPQRVASEDNGDNYVDIDYCVSIERSETQNGHISNAFAKILHSL